MSLAALSGARTRYEVAVAGITETDGLAVLDRDAVGVDLNAIRSTSADIDRIAGTEIQPGVGVV